MKKITVATRPFEGQKPGTSGLRGKTRAFMRPGFLENYVQSIWNATGGAAGRTMVLGGDGRYFNDRACQVILRMAAASGAARMIVGAGGILSTPAASNLIRARGADGGLILSASHNPGGPDADFGLKYNMSNGAAAPLSVTDAIHRAAGTISEYHILDAPDVDISVPGAAFLGGMEVEVVDPVADHADLMESLFDFDAIRRLFAGGFSMRFDAMHAVTGPYAAEIFLNRLGAPGDSVVNAAPLPDFGGGHPDPDPVRARHLVEPMLAGKGPDFAAASDGDGDRNMILGRGIYVTPSDSLAVLADNARLAPGYRGGLKGVARSMPTSRAVDRVARKLGLPSYETPTGWKFFGNLLDAGRITLCGEESSGTGSDHAREKDGLWAVLFWLNILAATGKSVMALMEDHWADHGRDYHLRHDYGIDDAEAARRAMDGLRSRLPDLPGTSAGGMTVEDAGEFSYADPVDGSVSTGQGLRVTFSDGSRVVWRLSGTGTAGATARVYHERFEDDPGRLAMDPAEALAPVVAAAEELMDLRGISGSGGPEIVA